MDAQIQIKATPAEFDLIRQAVKDAMMNAIENSKQGTPTQRHDRRQLATQLELILLKLN
jgi:hypothetical protein